MTRDERIAALKAELAELESEPQSAGDAVEQLIGHLTACDDDGHIIGLDYERIGQAVIEWYKKTLRDRFQSLANAAGEPPDDLETAQRVLIDEWNARYQGAIERVKELEAQLTPDPDRPLARGDVVDSGDSAPSLVVEVNDAHAKVIWEAYDEPLADWFAVGEVLEARKRWEQKR